MFKKLAACFLRFPGSVSFFHFFLYLSFPLPLLYYNPHFHCTPSNVWSVWAFVCKGALLGQLESSLEVKVHQSLQYQPSTLCILWVDRTSPRQFGFPVFPLLSILCVLLFLDLLNALFFPSYSSCRSADANEILWLLVVFLFVSWVLW